MFAIVAVTIVKWLQVVSNNNLYSSFVRNVQLLFRKVLGSPFLVTIIPGF